MVRFETFCCLPLILLATKQICHTKRVSVSPALLLDIANGSDAEERNTTGTLSEASRRSNRTGHNESNTTKHEASQPVSSAPIVPDKHTEDDDQGDSRSWLIFLVLATVLIFFAALSLWCCRRPWEELWRSLEPRPHDEIVVAILRSSEGSFGEELIKLQACFGKQVREKVDKYLANNEYLCQIVWATDDAESLLRDHEYFPSVGYADRCSLRAIVRSCWPLSSGVALFTSTQVDGATAGACQKVRIWIYEDKTAVLLCGDYLERVGTSETIPLDGHLDNKGNLKFHSEKCEAEGVLRGMYGRQVIAMSQVPILGSVDLKQELVEAVFDLSQKVPFEGWITFFCDGEVVATISKQGGASTQVCMWSEKKKGTGGSTKIAFSYAGELKEWKQNFDLPDRVGSCSGSWSGPIGQRRLLLFGFPILENIELVEQSLQ